MLVRKLVAADREAWDVLWRGYQEFYQVDLSAITLSTWERLLDPTPDGPFGLVAQGTDGGLLGLAHYLFHGTTWSPKPRCYLNDLYTAPESRGQGVGRALIEAVYEAADAHDCERVYWLTQDFNKEARVLYDKVAQLTPFIKYQR